MKDLDIFSHTFRRGAAGELLSHRSQRKKAIEETQSWLVAFSTQANAKGTVVLTVMYRPFLKFRKRLATNFGSSSTVGSFTPRERERAKLLDKLLSVTPSVSRSAVLLLFWQTPCETTRYCCRRLLAAALSPRQVVRIPQFHRDTAVSLPLTCSATAAASHPLGWRDGVASVCQPGSVYRYINEEMEWVREDKSTNSESRRGKNAVLLVLYRGWYGIVANCFPIRCESASRILVLFWDHYGEGAARWRRWYWRW